MIPETAGKCEQTGYLHINFIALHSSDFMETHRRTTETRREPVDSKLFRSKFAAQSSFSMMILAFACPAIFGIPMATAMMAKGQGRNPVLWFFLAYLLPVVSTLSLFFLKDKSPKAEASSELIPS